MKKSAREEFKKLELANLKNPELTGRLLRCSTMLCKWLEPIFSEPQDFESFRDSIYPIYNATKKSIEKIVERPVEETDPNQLSLELA